MIASYISSNGIPCADIDHETLIGETATSSVESLLAATDPSRIIEEELDESDSPKDADSLASGGHPTGDQTTDHLKSSHNSFKSPPKQSLPSTSPLTWRIDLTKSEPFWQGWFQGLSNLFLTAQASAKMLLLAGVDRLDKDLTVGQMQGMKPSRCYNVT